MIKYLKKYKELLKQLETNENKIQENKLLLDANCRKWNDIKDKEEKLELEIKQLNEEYQQLMEKKEKKFFNKLGAIVILLALTILILLAMFKAVFVLLATPILIVYSGIIYISIFLITKFTSILDKKFEKDKDITKLLESHNEKENELSNIKILSDKYSQEIIKYHAQSRCLNDQNLSIKNSINELMVEYATPIFDEQAKDILEEQSNKPLSRTKKQKI